MFKIRLKEIFRKPLKLEVFQELTKLRDKIETAQDKQVAREKFEKAFLHTAKKLIKKQEISRCYVFIKTFDDEYPKFKDELNEMAEFVLQNGDTGIIGDLYRTMPWTDSRYFIKAKTGKQVDGIMGTANIADGILVKDAETFKKDYNVVLDYVLEHGNDYECYALAKVSNGEVLSKLEDKFLKLNNNVFDIMDFALLNNVNDEKFIAKLLEYEDVQGANEVLEKKINSILGKVEKDKDLAEMYIDFCRKCGREDYIDVIKDVQRLAKISKKSKLEGKETNISKDDLSR